MIWRWLGLSKDSYRPEKDIGPYFNYRLAVRLELTQRPGVFAIVANLMAEEGASIGAVDMVSATKTKVVRDITLDTKSEEHAQRVLDRLGKLPDVKVLSASDRIPHSGWPIGPSVTSVNEKLWEVAGSDRSKPRPRRAQ